jgi:hypothetical protein
MASLKPSRAASLRRLDLDIAPDRFGKRVGTFHEMQLLAQRK